MRTKLYLIIPAVLCIFVFVVLVKSLFASKAVPSFDEFVGTSTDVTATSTTQAVLSEDIHAPKGTIHAFVADTDESREQGLSGHDPLQHDAGMLFVFPEPGSYAFWMKDMKFSLDMVWVNSDKSVLGVSRDLSPETFPNTFLPPSPASYVLELDAGDAAAFGIATGTVLRF